MLHERTSGLPHPCLTPTPLSPGEIRPLSNIAVPLLIGHRQHGHTTVDGCQAAGLPGSIEVSLPAPLKTPDLSGTDNFNSSELRRGEQQEAEGRSSTHARHENPTLMESCSTIWHHID
uniref:Uncharacterized protein n=1 Tax=Coccidioides posadasii RMSCC 3488 TaxID=454284 RepID=A0A0J6FN28_COCPO|nr:hypothetical protein CPAG_06626 [Coccidioides posadasii RMSCC 3488]